MDNIEKILMLTSLNKKNRHSHLLCVKKITHLSSMRAAANQPFERNFELAMRLECC